jgi:hypothetical protein
MEWHWAVNLTGDEVLARGVSPAPGDGAYVVGSFDARAPLRIGGTTVPARGSGKDLFIARLDGEGAVLWARAFGGVGDDLALDVATDPQGRPVLTGRIIGAVAFDSTITTSTDADAITVAFDADGGVRWLRLVSGGGASFGNEVAVDDDGRIAVVGSYADAASFGPGITLLAPASGGQDAFTALYGADGQPLWARSLAAPDSGATAAESARGVAFDGQSRVLVTGAFAGRLTIGTQSIDSGGGSDCFAASFSVAGELRWSRRFGGPGDDLCRGIGGDSFGTVSLGGNFTQSLTIGTTTLSAAGDADLFVASLDADGAPAWARRIGGTGDEEGVELDMSADGEVTVVGDLSGVAALPGGGTVSSVGRRDLLLARFATDGALEWQLTAGGPGDEVSYALAVSPSDRITVVGTYGANGSPSVSFGSATLSAAVPSAFIARARPVAGAAPPPTPPGSGTLRIAAASDYAIANGTRAFLVMQSGQLLHERYSGLGSATRSEALASGTKSFTCALAAVAEQEGLLDLDGLASAGIAAWLPGGAAPDNASKQTIRVRDLIALSHGLSAAGASGNALNGVDSYAQAIDARSLFPPDRQAVYSANGFQAFAAFFEYRTGGTNASNGAVTGGRDPLGYLQERVLGPIGASVGAWSRDINGKPNFGGGASMTARSWMLYGQLIEQEGVWNGAQLVSAARIRRCSEYRTPAFLGYGLGFWLNRPVESSYDPTLDQIPFDSATRTRLAAGGRILPDAPADAMFAWGAGNMKMFVIRSEDLVVVKLGGNADDNEVLGRLFGRIQ